jgi:hypothetical protein
LVVGGGEDVLVAEVESEVVESRVVDVRVWHGVGSVCQSGMNGCREVSTDRQAGGQTDRM